VCVCVFVSVCVRAPVRVCASKEHDGGRKDSVGPRGAVLGYSVGLYRHYPAPNGTTEDCRGALRYSRVLTGAVYGTAEYSLNGLTGAPLAWTATACLCLRPDRCGVLKRDGFVLKPQRLRLKARRLCFKPAIVVRRARHAPTVPVCGCVCVFAVCVCVRLWVCVCVCVCVCAGPAGQGLTLRAA
jgi:hypothetical protein